MKAITVKEVENWKVPEIESSIVHSEVFVTDLIEMWRQKPEEATGYPTEWPVFNQCFGGARPGEVIVLTGDTGSGKTTFATAWLLDTVRAGRPAFFISLEMSRKAIAGKLASMIGNKIWLAMETSERAAVMDVMKKVPIWYFDAKDLQADLMLFKAIQYAAFEKKCRFVILDHLEYVKKTRDRHQDESEVIREFMLRLCKIAQRTSTTILLIAHPSKLQTKGTQEREISMDELKGSSSIKQEADNVISIFSPMNEQNEMVVRFWKIRSDHFSKNRKMFVRFYWDSRRFAYSEVSTYPERGTP